MCLSLPKNQILNFRMALASSCTRMAVSREERVFLKKLINLGNNINIFLNYLHQNVVANEPSQSPWTAREVFIFLKMNSNE